MKFAKGLLIIIAVIISQSVIEAQPPMGNFTVKGKVLEQGSNNPLEYVNVVLYSMRDSSLVAGTITTKDGSFEITSTRPGRFYLTADFIGYEKQYVEGIMLNPGNEKHVVGDIQLKQTDFGIDEVEVVGERPFVSYQVDKKVVEVSRNPMAQGGTAVDALENVPSVETDMEGNVSVRGSSEFTVLIDGRQSPLTGSDALNQIPASAIDKIEIITNPSVKYDPDGTAGIINVITKKGKLKGHSLVLNGSLGTSPMGSFDANYTYRMKRATVFAGVGYRDHRMNFETFDDREITDSLKEKTFLRTDKTGQMQHSNISLNGGADFFLSDKNTLSVGASYSQFTFGRNFDSQIRTTRPDTLTNQLSFTGFNVTPSTLQFDIGDKHIFGDNEDHYLAVDFLFQTRKGETDDGMELYKADQDWEMQLPALLNEKAITIEDANRMRLDVDYSLPLSNAINIETGYTLRRDESNKDYARYLFDDENNQWVKNSEYDDNSEFTRTINAVWVLAKGELYGIGYSFGLRGEHTNRITKTSKDSTNSKYDYLGWYPSAAISREWENGHTLQANYSKRINRPRDYHLNPFPSLSDGYSAFLPNPQLEPEYASSVELNYQKAWGRQFLAVETFFKYTDNKINRIYQVESDTLLVRTMTNLGYEKSIGGELGGNLKIFKWWYLNPVVTVYYNELEGFYTNGIRVKSSTNSRVSITNNFTLSSKTRIQLMSNYRSPEATLDGERSETYWASAAIRHSFFDRKLSAVFRVDDIFSTRKRQSTTITENTVIYSEGQRKSPMFVLSLSLKLNQTNDKRNDQRRDQNGGGGGMDMDF